jgi:hypothetical protein
VAEKIVNNAVTTLASGINSSVTSLTVAAGAGALFPSTGNFRLRCGSELMLCTARLTDTLTVQRGIESTTAVSHSADDTIKSVLTAGAITQLLAEVAVAADPTVQALAALSSSNAGTLPYFTADDVMGLAAIGASGKDILAAETDADARSAIGAAVSGHTHTTAAITDIQEYTGTMPKISITGADWTATTWNTDLHERGVLFTSGAASGTRTLTIPSDATRDFPVGTFYAFLRFGNGAFKIDGEAPNMFRAGDLSGSPISTVYLSAPFTMGWGVKHLDDIWVLTGSLSLTP